MISSRLEPVYDSTVQDFLEESVGIEPEHFSLECQKMEQKHAEEDMHFDEVGVEEKIERPELKPVRLYLVSYIIPSNW